MRRGLVYLLLLFSLTLSREPEAQAAALGASSRLVLVVADRARGPALSQLFAAVLQARLSDVEVRFVPEATWNSMTTRPSAALLFHLDTSRDAVWTLRLVQSDRAWQRRLHGVSQDPAALEAAALIAARASVALLARESLSESERPEELTAWTARDVDQGAVADAREQQKTGAAEAPPPAPPSPSAPARDLGTQDDTRAAEAPLGLRLLAAYRGAPYASNFPWVHGAHAALLVTFRAGPCALVGYTYTPNLRVRTEFGHFDLSRYPAELQAGWCFRRGRFGVSPRLGVLVEPVRRRAAEAESGVGVSSSNTSVGWAAVSALAADWAPSERLLLYLGVSAAYFTSDLEYLAQGSRSSLFSPYQVRLRVDVGAQVVAF